MDLEGINKKSKKIRIYPTKEQKIIFSKWFGCERYVYNKTIEYLKQPDTKANWKNIKTDLIHNLPEWSKEIPYQIKSIAIKDACTSVSKAKKDYKKFKKFCEIKFKSRKAIKQSCYIPKQAISKNGIYHTLTESLQWIEELPEDFCDSRLVKENNRYYVCIPYPNKTILPCIENQDSNIVALDPGVRTFITFYSQDSCGKIGENAYERIYKLTLIIDKLVSRLSRTKGFFNRSRIKRVISKLKWKIQDLISDLHFKTALFLVKNFDIILLPTFQVSKMINKSKRKIRNKTVRRMLSLSHYKFKTILKYKAKEYGKLVVDVNEAYTSKTVSWTGEIIENLGGSKIIKSSIDGLVMDRDLNAARGIFLRALGDTPNN